MNKPSKSWFAPKRYGYGAGLPIAWQGWATLGAYACVILPGAWLISVDNGEFAPFAIGVMLAASIVLLIVAKARTRGGWRWRWGKEERSD